MIYFIKADEYIKVGYSKNEKAFKSRLSSYKTSCPFDVEVIAKMEGGVEKETDVLNHFVKFHKKGEWFYYDKSIEDYALEPYEIPKSIYLKPLNKTNKIIDENIEEILELYKGGMSLRALSEKFNINRKRLSPYITEDLRRAKNEWFKLRRREDNPNNIPIVCTTTGEHFISSAEASRVLKIPVSCIWKVLKGQRKHTKNLVFVYHKDYLEK